ncbi:hypothetical protein SPD48_06355 [Pseudogracilibacillus sp. SE30717A]|uniref:hypothetical protein n=1 Tax=Pseudogracilibacillus sp. SE30717A TaxID=3098293 RepID=UPI00300E159A
MRNVIVFILFSMIIITGCAEKEEHWRKSPLISFNDVVYYGTDQIFGMTKMNGDMNEPDFQKGQARLYHITFFDHTEENVGKTYKLTAFHEETGKTVDLSQDEIQGENAAKVKFDKSGFWKIEVFIDEELYTSFIVDVT